MAGGQLLRRMWLLVAKVIDGPHRLSSGRLPVVGSLSTGDKKPSTGDRIDRLQMERV